MRNELIDEATQLAKRWDGEIDFEFVEEGGRVEVIGLRKDRGDGVRMSVSQSVSLEGDVGGNPLAFAVEELARKISAEVARRLERKTAS